MTSASRKNLMLGTAGHVDHGKTALVKLLTGCETDTLAEEKQRGLTIDLGFAPCRLADDRIVGIVDVPGHVDFIRNMVAGAHGIDVVILVVAADDGIMPQTHEHLHILTLMGLRHGLVALTKIDLVEFTRREQVVADVRRLLQGTFLEQAPVCPISNLSGEGFENFFAALNQVVDGCAARPGRGLFHLWIEDVFTIRGSGTVITGIPSRGKVAAGDHLVLLPAGLSGRVRRMQVYGEDAPEGRAGECVALNLPEIDHTQVRRGMVLSASKDLAPITRLEGELRILETVPVRIKDFLEVQFHLGTASVMARLAMLEAAELSAGQTQMVQFRLAEPLVVVPDERFVIRANLATPGQPGLTTIGDGRVLGTSNVRLRRNRPWTLEMLAARRAAVEDPERWCELMLREAGRVIAVSELQGRCRLTPDEIGPIIQTLRSEGRVRQTSKEAVVHEALLREAGDQILTAIQAFHVANPQRAGLDRDALISKLKLAPELFDLASGDLLQSRQIEYNGTVFAQSGWSGRVSDLDRDLSEQIAARMKEAGWMAPTAGELAESLQEPESRVEKLLELLVERAILVRLDSRTVLHRDALEAAKTVALDLFRRGAGFSTMDFRDALGVSRKYAIPVLDYFDRIRFTVRSGHNRTPGVEARKQLSP